MGVAKIRGGCLHMLYVTSLNKPNLDVRIMQYYKCKTSRHIEVCESIGIYKTRQLNAEGIAGYIYKSVAEKIQINAFS